MTKESVIEYETYESPLTQEEKVERVVTYLSSKSVEEARKFRNNLRTLDRAQQEYPLLFYMPTDPQLAWHRLDVNEKFFCGGNSAGKTFAGCAEAAMYLYGEDPTGLTGRKFPEPRRRHGGIWITTQVWLVSLSLTKGIEIVRQNLLPLLKPGSYKFVPSDGVITMLSSGATLRIMSYDQGAEKFQSAAIDFLLYDEQPPWDVYHEGRARVARRDGVIGCCVTPLYMSSTWFYKEIHKKRNLDPKRGLTIEYIMADSDSNTYITDSARKRLHDSYEGRWDAKARLSGAMPGMENVVHPKFDREHHVIEGFPITEDILKEYKIARVIDLHPAEPCVCLWFLYNKKKRFYFLIKELAYKGSIKEFGARVLEIEKENKWTHIAPCIIDAPDAKEDKRMDGISLRNELSKVRIPGWPGGVTGGTAIRSMAAGIERFNDYLSTDRFMIFQNTVDKYQDVQYCTIDSIEDFQWKPPKGGETYQSTGERVLHKNDHWVRNCHFMALIMPSIDERKEEEKAIRKYGKKKAYRILNYAKGA